MVSLDARTFKRLSGLIRDTILETAKTLLLRIQDAIHCVLCEIKMRRPFVKGFVHLLPPLLPFDPPISVPPPPNLPSIL